MATSASSSKVIFWNSYFVGLWNSVTEVFFWRELLRSCSELLMKKKTLSHFQKTFVSEELKVVIMTFK